MRIGRRVVEILQARDGDGYVLRVDLRLRPSPEVTPIVLPVDAAISYYESLALPWERAAFIRGRAAAGDLGLGTRFLETIRPFIWRRALDFGAIGEIRGISRRIRDHHAQGQAFGPGFDLKRGRGGIREIEFFAQIHQLIHGGRDASVRAPATRDALARLAEAGWIDPQIASAMTSAYTLFRTIEHRVQMVDDRQAHHLPTGPALDGLARLHGVTDGAALLGLLRPHVEATALTYDALDPDDEGALSQDGEHLEEQLAEAGFADPPARGAADRAMAFGHLPGAAQPGGPRGAGGRAARADRGAGQGARSPGRDRAPRRHAGETVERDQFLPPAGGAAGPGAAARCDPEPYADPGRGAGAAARAVRRADRRHGTGPGGISRCGGGRDARGAGRLPSRSLTMSAASSARRGSRSARRSLPGSGDPLDVSAGYARVAEAAIVTLAEATVAEFTLKHGVVPDSELVILALGRMGGGALTHASDLDLVYLFTGDYMAESDGEKPLGAVLYYNRLAQRVSGALSAPTASGPLYDIDTRLRPSGTQGPLVVSLDGFARYQREDAWTWEHMALTRARPVFGSEKGTGRDPGSDRRRAARGSSGSRRGRRCHRHAG